MTDDDIIPRRKPSPPQVSWANWVACARIGFPVSIQMQSSARKAFQTSNALWEAVFCACPGTRSIPHFSRNVQPACRVGCEGNGTLNAEFGGAFDAEIAFHLRVRRKAWKKSWEVQKFI